MIKETDRDTTVRAGSLLAKVSEIPRLLPLAERRLPQVLRNVLGEVAGLGPSPVCEQLLRLPESRQRKPDRDADLLVELCLQRRLPLHHVHGCLVH